MEIVAVIILIALIAAATMVFSLLAPRHSKFPNPAEAPSGDIVLGSVEPAVPLVGLPHFRLTPEDQAHHATIWGRTGSGKSKLLESIFLQKFKAGQGVCLLDPHHDSATEILRYLTARGYFRDKSAYQRLVYIDWGSGHVVPFNILKHEDRPQSLDVVNDVAHSIALNVLDAAYRIWPELRSAPLFKELYLSGVLTLLSNHLPISFLHRLLDDAEFRAACLANVTDSLVLEAFHNFNALGAREQADKAGSTMRRAFDLTFHPIARLSLGSPDSVIRHRAWADAGISVIHDLGKIGDSLTKQIIGALLMVDLEQAFMSRSDVPVFERRPYTVLVDEWASFAAQDETISHVLSQTRKYGLRMYLAGQSMSQISSDRLAGALENCKLTVAFGLGRESALTQSRYIAPIDTRMVKEEAQTPIQHNQYVPIVEQFESWTQELQNLDTRLAYVKLHNKPPVKIKTLAMPAVSVNSDEFTEVLSTYQSMYQRTAPEAEKAISSIPVPGRSEAHTPTSERPYARMYRTRAKVSDDAVN